MKKLQTYLILGSGTLCFFPTMVFADDSDLTNRLFTIANSVLGFARSIAMPILAIMIVYYGFKIFTSGDAKGVEEAKRGLVRCVVGAIVVYFAPEIFNLLKGLFTGAEGITFTQTGL